MNGHKRETKARKRQKGRIAEGSFLRLPHFVVRSAEFQSLTPRATKAFVLIASRYNGSNNGDISIARQELPQLGFGSNGEGFAAGVRELVTAGFVIVTRPGAYRVGCSLYATTIEPLNASEKHDFPEERKASHQWRKKTP